MSERHVYEYVVDTHSDTAPARVVRLVGKQKKVLEVGAGPGSITRVLTREKNCLVTALEIDASAIELLSQHCNRVIRADLNNPDWPALLSDEKFDVVVAADVLEHVYDPLATLKRMKGLLNQGGSVVVSLPHVGHSTLHVCLFDEDFEYRDWGLLDRTHIRFFGIKNMQALFENAGLQIVEAQFVVRDPGDTEFAERWSKAPNDLRSALTKNRFGNVYQVVTKSVPKGSESLAIDLWSLPVEQSQASTTKAITPKLIAFYLTQFHPIPENDLWWGKGFTEWTNVTKAAPLFEDHYQPHLPADLGFYDLRLRKSRHDQIELAKRYGIDGFCYHYYWFSGQRILQGPLDDMLADPESDMPFCLCWANESWTKRWDAGTDEILLEQKYLPDDDYEFIKSLIPFFNDPRYIRLNGAPFLVVYRPQHIPDPKRSVSIWRDYCRSVGIDKIHVAAALIRGNHHYQQFGFDSGVEFPPHNVKVLPLREPKPFGPFTGVMLEYQDVAATYLAKEYSDPDVFRTVFPSWDNTARLADRAFVVLNGTPANYEYWLFETIQRTKHAYPDSERFVFINAWNEWAEGCHLEPDRKYGLEFLEATLRAKTGNTSRTGFEHRATLYSQAPRRLSTDLRTTAHFHCAAAYRRLRVRLSKHPRMERLVRDGVEKMRRIPIRRAMGSPLMLFPAVRRYLAEKHSIDVARQQAADERDRYLAELQKQSCLAENLGSERDMLMGERDQLHAALEALAAERKTLEQQRDDFSRQLDQQREDFCQQLDQQRKALDCLGSERDVIEQVRDELASELDAQRLFREALEVERDALKTERDAVKDELDQIRGELARKSTLLEASGAEREVLAKARSELWDEIGRERAAAEIVGAERDTLACERDRLRAARDHNSIEKATISRERDDLAQARDHLQGELERAITERNRLKEEQSKLLPAVLGGLTIIHSKYSSLERSLTSAQSAEGSGRKELLRSSYLDLLEDSLTGILIEDDSIAPGQHGYERARRELGQDWPRLALTMIGQARMRNIREAMETILIDDVKGDCLEAGVWRGGACIYMRGILKAYGKTDRCVWVADSFAGLPAPDANRYPADEGDIYHTFPELAVPLEQVRHNFARYGLLDEQVRFLKGWFKDSLVKADVEQIALLRLDADMYESTMDILNALYFKVSTGGFIIVDDYALAGCQKAVCDFRDLHDIRCPLQQIDGIAVYWRKSSPDSSSELIR